MKSSLAAAALGLFAAFAAGTARAQFLEGSTAGEFPPGSFTDGRTYSLADLRGKAVVLFFYEEN